MEITKHVVLLIVLHLVGFCYLINSSKKEKPLARPHGWHVANKRGWSTLFDPHGLNKSNQSSAPVISVVSLEDTQELAKLVSNGNSDSIINARRKKKRRRKQKRFQDDHSVLSHASELIVPRRKCKNWTDCDKNECCIRHMGKRGHCKKRPQKGGRCKPDIMPGLESCPCDKGLTCMKYKTTKWGYRKYRCQLINSLEEDEEDQRYL